VYLPPCVAAESVPAGGPVFLDSIEEKKMTSVETENSKEKVTPPSDLVKDVKLVTGVAVATATTPAVPFEPFLTGKKLAGDDQNSTAF